jgi:hypothetical protein
VTEVYSTGVVGTGESLARKEKIAGQECRDKSAQGAGDSQPGRDSPWAGTVSALRAGLLPPDCQPQCPTLPDRCPTECPPATAVSVRLRIRHCI